MSSGWRPVSLGDVAQRVNKKAHRSGVAKEMPYLGLENLTPGGGITSYSDGDSYTGAVSQFSPGDTLYGKLRPYFRKVARPDRPGVCTPEIWVLRPIDPDVVDGGFLFRTLSSQQFADWADSSSEGTRMPRAAWDMVAEYKFPLPPLDEQRRIAGVLGALDDLIEVNRGLIRDLDETVRLQGEQFMKGMDGRDRVPLSELAEISKGYSYKSSELVPSDTQLVNLKNVGRDGTFQDRGFKPLSGNPKPQHYVANGDILVAQTDLTQDRDVIGRPIRVRKGLLEDKLVASLDLVIVQPKESVTREFLFALLASSDFRNHALAHCNGTTVVHMAAAAVPSFEAPVPDETELTDFSNRVRVLNEAADALFCELKQLESARDELLPLLLSGRVRVGDVAA